MIQDSEAYGSSLAWSRLGTVGKGFAIGSRRRRPSCRAKNHRIFRLWRFHFQTTISKNNPSAISQRGAVP